MRKSMLLIILFTFVMFGTLSGALAGDPAKTGEAAKPANEAKGKGAEVTPQAQAVLDLDLAAQLAEWGERNSNPAALLVAAQIMKSVPMEVREAKKKVEGKPAADQGQKTQKAEPPESYLSKAAQLAKEKDPQLLAMIEKEGKIGAAKGAIGGPGYLRDQVAGNTRDIWPNLQVFRGGQRAVVCVHGDGDSDLDLYLFDEHGNLIASNEGPTDRCCVQWTPRYTGPFSVVVENHGPISNRYKLSWN